MIPPPIALGLTTCDQVIVEVGTQKVSLIGMFTRMRAEEFPFQPLPFCVFATLTGGRGEAEVTLAITAVETDEEVFTLLRRVTFPDRFAQVQVLFRLGECTFPASGEYMVTLVIDDDWVAHRRIQVRS